LIAEVETLGVEVRVPALLREKGLRG
jgi:hypothetical protein